MSGVLPKSDLIAKSVSATAGRHMGIVAKSWDEGVKSVLAYLLVFMRTNPGTVDEDLLDPNFRERLIKASERAHEATIPLLEKAAINGSLMGFRGASHNFDDLGLKLDEKFEFFGGDLLLSLQSDLDHIANQFTDAVLAAVQTENEDKVKAVFRRYSMRTQMVAEAATKMYAYRTLIRYMQGSPTVAEWRTTSAEPCKFCTYLNGQQREWGTPFEVPDFPIYGKVLYGPQLHPNCRCVLIAVKK